jgi:hypothetical protein
MSQELWYTSAPKGLQPGARGFCTVAMTRGMSAALVEKLESLSGYRPLYPPLDAKASLNPVAFSHLRINVGGRTYSLLSRICAAGLDYTERTNKLAHHVALEAGELPAAGPAWLLAQPGFMETKWDGEVKLLAGGRRAPGGNAGPAVCQAWQALTGDAGWAGILAESFQHDPSRLVYVLFEPGMQLLPLMAEALVLLPAEVRWEVTFSTYFTGLPQGVPCAWRCVPRDAVEAKSARQFPNALILNLGTQLGQARGGALVALARGQEVDAAALAEVGRSRHVAEESGQEREAAYERIAGSRRGQGGLRPEGRPNLVAVGTAQRLSDEPPALPFPPPPPRSFQRARKSSVLTSWSGGLAAGILLTLAVVGLGIQGGIIRIENNKTRTNNDQSGATQAGKTQAETPERKENNPLPQEWKKRGSSVVVTSTLGLLGSGSLLPAVGAVFPGRIEREEKQWIGREINRANEVKDLARKLEDAQKEKKKAERERDELATRVASSEKERRSAAQRLEDINKNGKSPAANEGAAVSKETEVVQLNLTLPNSPIRKNELLIKDLGPNDAAKCKLELLGLQDKVDADHTTVTKSGKELEILLQNKGDKPRPLARFWLEGSKLHFEWQNDGKDSPLPTARRYVRNSVLKIVPGDGAGKPIHVGLMLRPLKEPVFNFRDPKDYLLDFGATENKPTSAVFITSAKGEIKSARSTTQTKKNQIDLGWNENVSLRVEKKGDESFLIADWKGDPAAGPMLSVRSCQICMVVHGLNVKVMEIGKETGKP